MGNGIFRLGFHSEREFIEMYRKIYSGKPGWVYLSIIIFSTLPFLVLNYVSQLHCHIWHLQQLQVLDKNQQGKKINFKVLTKKYYLTLSLSFIRYFMRCLSFHILRREKNLYIDLLRDGKWKERQDTLIKWSVLKMKKVKFWLKKRYKG